MSDPGKCGLCKSEGPTSSVQDLLGDRKLPSDFGIDQLPKGRERICSDCGAIFLRAVDHAIAMTEEFTRLAERANEMALRQNAPGARAPGARAPGAREARQ